MKKNDDTFLKSMINKVYNKNQNDNLRIKNRLYKKLFAYFMLFFAIFTQIHIILTINSNIYYSDKHINRCYINDSVYNPELIIYIQTNGYVHNLYKFSGNITMGENKVFTIYNQSIYDEFIDHALYTCEGYHCNNNNNNSNNENYTDINLKIYIQGNYINSITEYSNIKIHKEFSCLYDETLDSVILEYILYKDNNILYTFLLQVFVIIILLISIRFIIKRKKNIKYGFDVMEYDNEYY